MSIISKMFGTHSERELKRVYPIVDKIESYRPAMMELTDEQLRDMTKEFKKRLIADVVTGKIDVRGIEIPEYDLVEEDSDGESEENTESMEGEMDEE